MDVKIKKFEVDMVVRTKGIELEVRHPNGRQIGDLVITKANIIWCPGKTARQNGMTLSWNDFVNMMNDR